MLQFLEREEEGIERAEGGYLLFEVFVFKFVFIIHFDLFGASIVICTSNITVSITLVYIYLFKMSSPTRLDLF